MITSTGNARIRELVRMKKSAKDRKVKDAFIVEGPKMFREIPAQLLQEVYVAESFRDTGCGLEGSQKPVRGLEGSQKPVRGLEGSQKPVRGLEGSQKPARGLEGSQEPVRDSEGPRNSVRGSEGFRKQSRDAEASRNAARGAGMDKAEVVSDSVFQYLSDTRTPQGILAVVKQLHYKIDDLFGETPLIIVLENVQDPGNLGTILRTAEAAGVTGILMSEGCADIYNPKVTRSTMGSIFRVPFVYTSDLAGSLEILKSRGVKLYAAHLQGSEDLYAQSYTSPSAFLVGNESRGLMAETAALADKAVRIDMSGEVESLNAAVASAVMMFEAKRQRMSS